MAKNLDEVIEKYGAVLEDTSAATIVRDAAELPYTKDVIKRALHRWIEQLAGDAPAQEWVRVAYLHLADFQELTEDERRANAAMSQQTLANASLPSRERAQHLASVMHVYDGLIERWNAEKGRLQEELNSIALTETVYEILVQDILTNASKMTIVGWFAGLAWFAYSGGDPALGFFGWMLLMVGGMFLASIILGGGVALAIAGLSKLVAGKANAMPRLFAWGDFISGVPAFLCARPAAEQLAALMN